MKNDFTRFLIAMLAAGTCFASYTIAAVPASYKGKPFGGTPREIPGRINFHDYDLGGADTSFHQDDMAYNPISGGGTAGGRDNDGNKDHPSFVMTNHGPSPSDTFYAVGVSYPSGVRYPSSDTSVAASDWYIGACHANNWFNVTVHVSKPGKYWISSIWAAMETTIQYQIFFIGTQYASTKDTLKSDTVRLAGYDSYHAWRKYNDFTSVKLDSGVQVMKFFNESYHLNQDYIYFAADSGTFSTNALQYSIKATKSGPPAVSFSENTARFLLPDAGMTRLSVFDCFGREILRPANRRMQAGNNSMKVNMSGLGQGMYFLDLEHNGLHTAGKFQIIK